MPNKNQKKCAKTKMSQSKYWCFTLNNYKPNDVLLLRQLGRRDEVVTYLVFGREGRTTPAGTPHLQGYVELRRRLRLSQLKVLIGQRAHFERRRGTGKEAADYCKKEGDFEEYGTAPTGKDGDRGRRSDLEDIRQQITNGAGNLEIAETNFSQWCFHRKAFQEYRLLRSERSTRDVKVFSLVGEPGVGKTRLVFHLHPGVWSCPSTDLRWFDGYSGESTVLFDDYRGGADGSFLLRVLDRYPLQVPIKGGFVAWIPTRIYITSNLAAPYGHDDIQKPVQRRINNEFFIDDAINFESPEELSGWVDELEINQ